MYKKGPKAIVSNYRPISLLLVLEKLMYKRLVNFLEQNQVYFMDNLVFVLIYLQPMQYSSLLTKFKKQLNINLIIPNYSINLKIHDKVIKEKKVLKKVLNI